MQRTISRIAQVFVIQFISLSFIDPTAPHQFKIYFEDKPVHNLLIIIMHCNALTYNEHSPIIKHFLFVFTNLVAFL